MDFKTYLTESRTQSLDFTQGLKFLQANCGQARALGPYLWRGSPRTEADAGIIDPSNFFRASSSLINAREGQAYNYHNFLMDILPSWSQYPKRSKSVIFTNNKPDATGYIYGYAGEHSPATSGGLYNIYPFDGAKIGIAKGSDVWSYQCWEKVLKLFKVYAIRDVFRGINDIISWIMDGNAQTVTFIKYLQNTRTYHSHDKNIESMINGLNKMQTFINENYSNLSNLISNEIDGGDFHHAPDSHTHIGIIILRRIIKQRSNSLDIMKWLDELMEPTANGFTVTTIDQLSKQIAAHEMWTDSKCLLMRDVNQKAERERDKEQLRKIQALDATFAGPQI